MESIVILLLLIVVSLISLEMLGRKNIIQHGTARNALHIIAGSAASIAPLIYDDIITLTVISFLLAILTFFLVKNSILKSIDPRHLKSWGIFYFPLSYFILLLFWGNDPWIISFSILILSFGYSLAAFFGSRFSKNYFILSRDKKSFIGSLIFFIVTFLVLFFWGVGLESLFGIKSNVTINADVYYLFAASILIAAILTVIEALSSSGLDNLLIPLFSAVLLSILFENPNKELLINFIQGMLLAAFVAVVSYRVKFLTASGAAATFLLAGFIFGLGGWKWSVPILLFFILSSLLSKLRLKVNLKVESYFNKSGVRDYLQVAANGGLGGLLVILNVFDDNPIYYIIYLASLAAVCSDTWATEIGTLKETDTYNILNFKKIEQGMSGGISLIGTLGGMVGGSIIALSGYFWFDNNLLISLILITSAGIAGSLFDSFLGAKFQIQYKCGECDRITEKKNHCNKESLRFRGLGWLDNDMVNLFAGIFGGIFAIVVSGIILCL
ncbi:MAG: DUF92 domain-containing protein [Bacteroidetes bacterium]|nr:DUF92 domain-containing protein [Bacteroidota bacterium]